MNLFVRKLNLRRICFGWHTGEIMYFNTKLQEYLVTFDEKNASFFYKVKLSTVAYVSGEND